MASQIMNPTPPAAHVVGSAFVEQYYSILHHQPEIVHKFYQDSSILSRPDPSGGMCLVTTMQAINDKVMSLDSKNFKAEIQTVDAQHSYKEGVIVLVTGCLTGKDNVQRRFTQSFFLAPQDKGGYFVLNDVFRYVDESQLMGNNHMLVNGANDSLNAPATSDPEPTTVQGQHLVETVTLPMEDLKNDKEVYSPLENGGPVGEEEVVVDLPVKLSQQDIPPPSEVTTTVAQEDAPKKSYASIVKVLKGNTGTTTVRVTTTKAKSVIANSEKHAPAPASTPTPTPAPEATSPGGNNAPDNSDSNEEVVEGYSIYVRNLPLNATPAQVEEEFKKFGPIKPGGVQVRNHKQHGYCFGFVEFESSSSMHAAIKAAPVMMARRQVVVEEKRTTTRVGSGNGSSSAAGGRGQFPFGRGGFRGDNFRGRGGFIGGQGYGRSEFRNEFRNEFRTRGDFSNRGRGPPSRVSEGYRWAEQNGGRIGRPNGMSQTAILA